MRKIHLIVVLFLYSSLHAQELNCEVVVNAQLTGNENVQLFKTLENQLNEFINNTNWTNKTFLPQERIACNMVINISSYNNDMFNASIQVASTRPIFNSTYQSPVYNFNDRNFSFRYLEYQNLNYSPIQFESNLISVLAFHVYIILGLDAETYKIGAGDEYFGQASTIVGYSQQGNAKGWEPPNQVAQTRSALINDILSPTFKEYKTVLYQYHRNGLDLMSEDVGTGKKNIAESLNLLLDMHKRRPNSFLQRVFFDAKNEEIKDIFSGGPKINIKELVNTLNKIAPSYSSSWNNITF